MAIVRQVEVTPAEIALRRELEIRFSRVLAEILRQPRSQAIPPIKMGSSCAVAILNAIMSICSMKHMELILDDFFEELFAIWAKRMKEENVLPIPEPPLSKPKVLEPSILEPEEPKPFACLLHSENTKETDESEIDQVLLEFSRHIDPRENKK